MSNTERQVSRQAFKYLRGNIRETRKPNPTFEFKASATGYTGGGYARIRTEENRPDKPGDGLDTTYVYVHRLAAVVWCYPDDMPLEEIFEDMDGKDVHHTLGMPAANGEEFVEMKDHGTHGSTTQKQRRAWAEDAKRLRDGVEAHPDDCCDECGSEARDAEFDDESDDGVYCMKCASENANGRTINIL